MVNAVKKTFAVTLFLLVISFPVSGLAVYKAYPGPELPEDQIAIIKRKLKLELYDDAGVVGLGALDGQKLHKHSSGRASITVKPGKHTLGVALTACSEGLVWVTCYTRVQRVSIEAEAGHTYMVYGIYRTGMVWIEDKKTKQVVAGWKPMLHEAAAKGDLDQIEQLIAQGADVKEKDKDGNTPLHKAAIHGHVDVARALITEGAKVKTENNAGDTSLHTAAYYGHTAVVELLIANGAKVNSRNDERHRPLGLATQQGYKDTIDLLKRHGGKE